MGKKVARPNWKMIRGLELEFGSNMKRLRFFRIENQVYFFSFFLSSLGNKIKTNGKFEIGGTGKQFEIGKREWNRFSNFFFSSLSDAFSWARCGPNVKTAFPIFDSSFTRFMLDALDLADDVIRRWNRKKEAFFGRKGNFMPESDNCENWTPRNREKRRGRRFGEEERRENRRENADSFWKFNEIFITFSKSPFVFPHPLLEEEKFPGRTDRSAWQNHNRKFCTFDQMKNTANLKKISLLTVLYYI